MESKGLGGCLDEAADKGEQQSRMTPRFLARVAGQIMVPFVEKRDT